jgi:hypothetical protein
MLTEFPVFPWGRLPIDVHLSGGFVRSTNVSAVGTAGTQPSLTAWRCTAPLTASHREGHDFSRADSGCINPGFSR